MTIRALRIFEIPKNDKGEIPYSHAIFFDVTTQIAREILMENQPSLRDQMDAFSKLHGINITCNGIVVYTDNEDDAILIMLAFA